MCATDRGGCIAAQGVHLNGAILMFGALVPFHARFVARLERSFQTGPAYKAACLSCCGLLYSTQRSSCPPHAVATDGVCPKDSQDT